VSRGSRSRPAIRGLLCALAACLLMLPVAAAGTESSMVWRVSGPEGNLYLAGSIHVLRADDYPLPDAFDAAWAATDTIFMEIDPAVLLDPSAAAPYMHLLLNDGGRTLDEFLSRSATRAEVREIQERSRAQGVDLASLQPFRPWAAAVTVMQAALLRGGYDPAWGVDQRLGARALSEGRPAIGLETLEDQLSIFAGFTPAQEAQFLLGMLRDANDLETEVRPLINAWRIGDRRALVALAVGSFEDFPELEAKLLTDRNARWFATLRPLLDREGQHLVVVGALHLVGQHGLLQLFERAGFEVEQL
jgi:uncharacterized protein